MAEFQELIKNFDRIRDYMRQFYVYGFKSRNDFDAKSAGPMTMNGGGSKAGSGIIPAQITQRRASMSISMLTAKWYRKTLCMPPGNQKVLLTMTFCCIFLFWISFGNTRKA